MSFDEALEDARENVEKLHVLLGNGFSIACRPDRFSYGALLDEATFESAAGEIRGVFELLGTTDFEYVIEQLQTAAALLETYSTDSPAAVNDLRHDAGVVRDALAVTLASKHPDLPSNIQDEEYLSVRRFLSNFDRIYTLNYDMLLYWAVMQDGEPVVERNDGFTNPDDPDVDYVAWEPYVDFRAQRLFYLHGGLHLYDSGAEISKITWSRTGVPLVDQIRQALADGRYPLIVTEGSTRDKEEKILHNAYLNHAIRSFAHIGHALFVFGHSLASSDEHVLRRIEEGSIKRLYVSVHGDPTSMANLALIARAEEIVQARPSSRPLRLLLFAADSAGVWQ